MLIQRNGMLKTVRKKIMENYKDLEGDYRKLDHRKIRHDISWEV